MLRISELNARTNLNKKKKNGRKSNKSEKTQRARDAINEKSRIDRRKKKIEKITSEASQLGKVTQSGKRMCMWEGCSTVLSVYNSGECCGLHQRAWNERRGVSLHW